MNVGSGPVSGVTLMGRLHGRYKGRTGDLRLKVLISSEADEARLLRRFSGSGPVPSLTVVTAGRPRPPPDKMRGAARSDGLEKGSALFGVWVGVSPASGMGPSGREFGQQHGTTPWPVVGPLVWPVMGPPPRQ